MRYTPRPCGPPTLRTRPTRGAGRTYAPRSMWRCSKETPSSRRGYSWFNLVPSVCWDNSPSPTPTPAFVEPGGARRAPAHFEAKRSIGRLGVTCSVSKLSLGRLQNENLRDCNQAWLRRRERTATKRRRARSGAPPLTPSRVPCSGTRTWASSFAPPAESGPIATERRLKRSFRGFACEEGFNGMRRWPSFCTLSSHTVLSPTHRLERFFVLPASRSPPFASIDIPGPRFSGTLSSWRPVADG